MIQRINITLKFLLIPALFFLMFGIYKIDKYVNWALFVTVLIVLGVLLSLIVSSILFQLIKDSLNKKEVKELEKQRFHFKIGIVFTLIFFGGGVLLGESISTVKGVKQFQIVRKGTSGLKKNRQFYLFINREGKLERYSFGKSTYDLYEAGDSINLTLKSNLYGFEYYEPERWNM
ncbi:MAG: hypothetical protein LPK21_15155 [Hymenobacteraceae bacterium]|nr:hypothetical protein [Hymenobacteraceae bacterium]